MADPGSGRRTVTACTVVAANYLPAARVLAASYLAHHPDHRFLVAVVDAPADERRADTEALVVGPDAFGMDRTEYLRMATAYTVTELATAVKPFLFRELCAESDVVIFLDPDIQMFAPMPEIADLALRHGLVLTPHVLAPLPRDGREPDEAVIMGTGIFNLGFLALGPGSAPFLDFWATRLRHDAIVDPAHQLFTDQRWVDQVPALFGHIVHRDPGCDVAYWNAHERPLRTDVDGTVRIGDTTLKFFHFSGYRPERPWQLSYHCARDPRVVLSEHPVLRRLCDGYGAALRANGYAETLDSVPYGFAALADGTRVSTAMRRLFRSAWIEAEKPRATTGIPPHAFDGTDAFARWLASPADRAQRGSGQNRLVMSAWAARPDLRRAFPRPYAEDADAFRHWCATSGVAELNLPSWALPMPPAAADTAADESPGVNMLGYFTAELGLGEMARLCHEAVQHSGIPVATVVEEKAVSNRTALDRPSTEGAARYGVSLVCVNADQTQVMSEAHPAVFADRYVIGFWAWELEDFPDWLHPAFGLVDEIWTVSEFCATAIRRHTTKPVHVFPAPLFEKAPAGRGSGERTQFLFAFDYNSVGERKNPWGLVEAFRLAFPAERTDVRLVIKAINGDRHPLARERLRIAALDDERISLIERYLTVTDLDELYRESDCYVSLHRSEGFGLTVAQAMMLGMPAVSTDYSGTAEFIDAKTGWPVPYRMVEVGPDCFPYHESAVWAEPDLASAADALRQVADDPGEAAARGQAAREHVLRTRTMTAAATWVAEHLRTAHATWLARRAPEPAPPQPLPDPLDPLRTSAEALRWRADPGSGSSNPVAPTVRRAVLRALDHYDVHQRGVLGELHTGTTETTRLLLQRIEWLEARMDAADTAASATADSAALLARRTDELESEHKDLRRRAPGVDLGLRNLERDVAGLRAAERDQHARLSATRTELFEALADRDRRADGDEHMIGELDRRWRAVEDAARLRHAPLPPGTDVVLCDAGALLVPDDAVIAPWLRHHRSWERAESELMATLVGDGAFLDVGAHVGYHSLALWRRLGAVAGIVAVEADPGNAALLRRNITVNLPPEAAASVAVLTAAAWDSDTMLRLGQVEAGNSGDLRVRETGDGVPVPAVRLDGQAAVTARRVGLIKTDLQGRDHRALLGLAGLIARDHPHVVVEYSPAAIAEFGDDPRAVLRQYTGAGYTVVPVDYPDAESVSVDSLCDRAAAQDSGLLTLWLRPAR